MTWLFRCKSEASWSLANFWNMNPRFKCPEIGLQAGWTNSLLGIGCGSRTSSQYSQYMRPMLGIDYPTCFRDMLTDCVDFASFFPIMATCTTTMNGSIDNFLKQKSKYLSSFTIQKTNKTTNSFPPFSTSHTKRLAQGCLAPQTFTEQLGLALGRTTPSETSQLTRSVGALRCNSPGDTGSASSLGNLERVGRQMISNCWRSTSPWFLFIDFPTCSTQIIVDLYYGMFPAFRNNKNQHMHQTYGWG